MTVSLPFHSALIILIVSVFPLKSNLVSLDCQQARFCLVQLCLLLVVAVCLVLMVFRLLPVVPLVLVVRLVGPGRVQRPGVPRFF